MLQTYILQFMILFIYIIYNLQLWLWSIQRFV